jgi:D-alanyl-D-alanine carboxypeptidase
MTGRNLVGRERSIETLGRPELSSAGRAPVTRVWVAIFALVLGACATGGSSPPSADKPAEAVAGARFAFPTGSAQQILDRFVASSKAPGAVVAMSVRGGPTTVLASGVADPKSGTPMKPDDVFRVASITKTFVGALVLTLVDDGRVKLDAPMNRYGLGWPNGDHITVRELLNHTSGIAPLGGDDGSGTDPYAQAFGAKILADLSHHYTPAEILAFVRPRPPLFPPGTATSYSNINTILAGQIVEHVTGQTLTAALRKRLLDPLKLTATHFAAEEALPIQPVPGLFTLQPGGPLLNTADFPTTALVTALGAAGAMTSDASDLVSWGRALLRDRRASPATRKTALAIQPGGTGLGVLGYTTSGFCVFNQGGCPAGIAFTGYGGSGAVPGTACLLIYDNPPDTVLAMCANRQPVDGLEDTATQELANIADAEAPQPTATGQPVPAPLAGTWQLDEAPTITLTLSGRDYRLGAGDHAGGRGQVAITDGRISLFNSNGCDVPPAIGIYTWKITGTKLRFDPLNKDPCGRSNILAHQTWTLRS